MRTSTVAFACLVALTGCSRETLTPESSGGGATAPVVLPGTVDDRGKGDATGGTLGVELGDFYFGPTFVKGRPGAKVTLDLRNTGAAEHTFTVDAPKVDVTVDAGGTGVAAVTLPRSGALAFYCRFHRGQGIQGAFYFSDDVVVAPGTVTPAATATGGDGAYGQ